MASQLSMINRKISCTNLLLLVGAALTGGCEREKVVEPRSKPVTVAPVARADILEFSDELGVEDESVNNFVRRAMTDCASGDYERFRMLWSAKVDPLPADEYEQGWQAVTRIEIRALQKVLLAAEASEEAPQGGTAYAVLADVSLDPTHPAGKDKPLREVVLLVVSEQDGWRLANPPQAMKRWIRNYAAEMEESASESPPDTP